MTTTLKKLSTCCDSCEANLHWKYRWRSLDSVEAASLSLLSFLTSSWFWLRLASRLFLLPKSRVHRNRFLHPLFWPILKKMWEREKRKWKCKILSICQCGCACDVLQSTIYNLEATLMNFELANTSGAFGWSIGKRYEGTTVLCSSIVFGVICFW